MDAQSEPRELSVRPGLRVLQVIDQDPVKYPPTLNAARVLAAAGAQVLCLATHDENLLRPELPANARLHYLRGAARRPTGIRRLRQLLAFRRAILAHAESFAADLVIAYDNWAGWATLPLTRRGGFRTVLHIHDNVRALDAPLWSALGLGWRQVARNARRFSLVVVPEERRAAHLRDAWGISAPIAIAANSPPVTAQRRNDVLRRLVDCEACIAGKPLAVSLGNMGLYRETADALALTRSEWHLAIVGSGNALGVSEMRRRAVQLGIAERLHVVPYSPYDVTREWLLGCDVGLGFYPHDTANVNWINMGTASVKIQEYLAAGIPSVVAPPGSFTRLAEDSRALVLCDEDARSIAGALDNLEPVSASWQQRSRAARAAHLSKYNCEVQLGGVLRLLGLDQ